jgi:hypothetical protein
MIFQEASPWVVVEPGHTRSPYDDVIALDSKDFGSTAVEVVENPLSVISGVEVAATVVQRIANDMAALALSADGRPNGRTVDDGAPSIDKPSRCRVCGNTSRR